MCVVDGEGGDHTTAQYGPDYINLSSRNRRHAASQVVKMKDCVMAKLVNANVQKVTDYPCHTSKHIHSKLTLFILDSSIIFKLFS